MRDSIGSVYPLVIVIGFIVLMSGFLAFSVNYNKAFRMKNKIIYVLEKYNNNPASVEAQNEIREYAQSIGYSASGEYTAGCNGSSYSRDANSTGWCYKQIVTSNDVNGERTNGEIAEYVSTYVNIKTFVSIDVPIFNKLFPNIRFFTVTGSTKQITTLKK